CTRALRDVSPSRAGRPKLETQYASDAPRNALRIRLACQTPFVLRFARFHTRKADLPAFERRAFHDHRRPPLPSKLMGIQSSQLPSRVAPPLHSTHHSPDSSAAPPLLLPVARGPSRP